MQDLHHSSVVNGLLAVLELGFRCSVMEVRTQAFRSWRILIDVFAEKSQWLLDVSRPANCYDVAVLFSAETYRWIVDF